MLILYSDIKEAYLNCSLSSYHIHHPKQKAQGLSFTSDMVTNPHLYFDGEDKESCS